MKGSEELQIGTGNIFKELPQKISLSFRIVNSNNLLLPESLFDPDIPLGEPDLGDSLLPVIVRPYKNNRFAIIDGGKRYLRCIKEGQKKISCNIIQTQLNEFATGLLRLALNKNRPQNLRERVLFLFWLKKKCTKAAFGPYALKAGFSPKDIAQLGVVFSLDNHTKEALFTGSLDLSFVPHFLVLTPKDRRCFLETFKGLKLSLQTQREFLEWLPEIAYNEQKTISAVLTETQIKTTLENKKLNDPQRIQKVHAYLYTKKYPRLASTQDAWKKHASALNPDPACVSFIPSPYFEKNLLEIKISVANSLGAVNIFKELKKVSSDDWQKMIYPLS